MGLLLGILVFGIGFVYIAAATFDLDFFINSFRGRFLVSLFGRKGARIFYFVVGSLLVVIGWAMLTRG